MSFRRSIILFAIAALLQLSLLNLVQILGVTPNLILCLAVFMAYRIDGGFRPALVAVPFALLMDLASGPYVGISALCMFLLLLAVFWFGRDFNRENLLTLFVLSAVSILIYYMAYWGVMVLLGSPANWLRIVGFMAVALPYNLAVIMAMGIFRQRFRFGRQTEKKTSILPFGKKTTRYSARYDR